MFLNRRSERPHAGLGLLTGCWRGLSGPRLERRALEEATWGRRVQTLPGLRFSPLVVVCASSLTNAMRESPDQPRLGGRGERRALAKPTTKWSPSSIRPRSYARACGRSASRFAGSGALASSGSAAPARGLRPAAVIVGVRGTVAVDAR